MVNAYGARPELTRGGRARWDYEEESPLRDARGFTYSGALYDPAEALADEDLGLANLILTNGARLYVDHAHPEYSTPEVTNPRVQKFIPRAPWTTAAKGTPTPRPPTPSPTPSPTPTLAPRPILTPTDR